MLYFLPATGFGSRDWAPASIPGAGIGPGPVPPCAAPRATDSPTTCDTTLISGTTGRFCASRLRASGRTSSRSGLRRPTKYTDSGSSVTATAPTAVTMAVVNASITSARDAASFGWDQSASMPSSSSPRPRENWRRPFVLNSPSRVSLPTPDSTTSERQHGTKHEQGSVTYARIILQGPPEGRTGVALKDHGSVHPILKAILERRIHEILPWF
jgi:hypothetical protein